MNAIGRKLRIGVALVLACATSACLAGAAAASPVAPASDPFYAYSGSLQHVPAGTVLRRRSVAIAIADTALGHGGSVAARDRAARPWKQF